MQFATQEVPRFQQIIAKQSPELKLYAFIPSNTPFASLGWSADGPKLMDKPAIEQLGVLFQADDPTTYVDTMMSVINSSDAPTASPS